MPRRFRNSRANAFPSYTVQRIHSCNGIGICRTCHGFPGSYWCRPSCLFTIPFSAFTAKIITVSVSDSRFSCQAFSQPFTGNMVSVPKVALAASDHIFRIFRVHALDHCKGVRQCLSSGQFIEKLASAQQVIQAARLPSTRRPVTRPFWHRLFQLSILRCSPILPEAP